MELEKIMQEISAGLTGDNKSDIAYLVQQTEKYRDNQFGTEIAREIGRMIFERLPKEDQEEWNESLTEELKKSFYSKFDEVKINVQNKEFEKALSIIEPIVNDFEKMINGGLCRDDSVNEYRHFDSLFEEIMYKEMYRPSRIVHETVFPIGRAFSVYGSILIDLNRVEEARLALGTAKQWEPMNVSLAFEYAETYKIQGLMEQFLDCTKKTYEIIYKKTDLARFYRNVGFYFIEKKLWREAIASYVLSLNFESESPMVASEIAYIEEKAGQKIEWPKIEEIKDICNKRGIPFGLNTNVAVIAYRYGKALFDDKNFEYAKYFLEIAYSMVQAPEIKKMLDTLASTQGSVDILKYLNLPKEFQPVRNRPTDPANCESFMMQNSNTLAFLQVFPIDVNSTMPFLNPQEVIDGIHRTLKDDQALIEVENGSFGDSRFIYSIIKNLHKESLTGIQYFMLMHVLVEGCAFAVQGFFDEFGTTGVRDSVVFELMMRTKETDTDLNGWQRDPYDKDFNRKFLMNLSEERRFDKLFPEHPLSVCRNFIERVKNSLNKGKKSESESDFEKYPKQPAERPKGKSVIECCIHPVVNSGVDYVHTKFILYTDGRLYKAIYTSSNESIVNGKKMPVLYELIGTSEKCAKEIKSFLMERSNEYKTWPMIISNYGKVERTSYSCSLKFPSKQFSGLDMFEVDKYGPLIKGLYEKVATMLEKYFPEIKLTDDICCK